MRKPCLSYAKSASAQLGKKGIPYIINTYNGRPFAIRTHLITYQGKLDLDLIKFDVGNVVMVTGGRTRGRVGILKNRDKHKAGYTIGNCLIIILFFFFA
ncbi:hypothetical protein ABFS82_04G143600 [Erythranthe guttata]